MCSEMGLTPLASQQIHCSDTHPRVKEPGQNLPGWWHLRPRVWVPPERWALWHVCPRLLRWVPCSPAWEGGPPPVLA